MFTSPSRRELRMMSWAMAGAQIFSTCAKRQYMAIVLSPDGRVIGTGYNGSPPGLPHCNEGACPRLQNNTPAGSPYTDCISVHAEANALMFSNRDERHGGTLIINGQPCWDCGKLIAGSGVSRLVHLSDAERSDSSRVNGLIAGAGIEVCSIDPAML